MSNPQCFVLFLCGALCITVSLGFYQNNRLANPKAKTGDIEFTKAVDLPPSHYIGVFQYIELEQPLHVKAGEKLLYNADLNELHHVRDDGITVGYERVYLEEKRTYVYRALKSETTTP